MSARYKEETFYLYLALLVVCPLGIKCVFHEILDNRIVIDKE